MSRQSYVKRESRFTSFNANSVMANIMVQQNAPADKRAFRTWTTGCVWGNLF